MEFNVPVKEKDVNSINIQGCWLQTKRTREKMRSGRVSVFVQLKKRFALTVQIEIVGFHESFEYKFKDWLDEDEQVIVC